MTISIFNLLTLPYLNYYELVKNEGGQEFILQLQFNLNIFYMIELLLLIFVLGIYNVFTKETLALRAEAGFQIATLTYLGSWREMFEGGADPELRRAFLDLVQVLILVRLLRITKFLDELEQWEFFVRSIKVMQGPFFNLCLSVYSVFFFYTLIGMDLFGGKINCQLFVDIDRINGEDSEISPDYMWLNFNDYASGLITLFSMMLFNNWQFIWQQFNFAVESDLKTNSFFLSFIILSSYIIMNILMAFVIDVYTSIEESVRKEKDEKKAIVKFGEHALQWEYEQSKKVGLQLFKNLSSLGTNAFGAVKNLH